MRSHWRKRWQSPRQTSSCPNRHPASSKGAAGPICPADRRGPELRALLRQQRRQSGRTAYASGAAALRAKKGPWVLTTFRPSGRLALNMLARGFFMRAATRFANRTVAEVLELAQPRPPSAAPDTATEIAAMVGRGSRAAHERRCRSPSGGYSKSMIPQNSQCNRKVRADGHRFSVHAMATALIKLPQSLC